MFILIGLGNPGKKYASTRHNAGKMLAAWLKNHPLERFEITETDCFMNQSGEWIAKRIQNSEFPGLASARPRAGRIQNLIVAHDDLDLPLGSFKIHFGRGPRLHKGILSIEQALGTKDFWRVRIGIDNRRKAADDIQHSVFSIQYSLSGEDYVLQPFKREEKKILISVFSHIRDKIVSLSP